MAGRVSFQFSITRSGGSSRSAYSSGQVVAIRHRLASATIAACATAMSLTTFIVDPGRRQSATGTSKPVNAASAVSSLSASSSPVFSSRPPRRRARDPGLKRGPQFRDQLAFRLGHRPPSPRAGLGDLFRCCLVVGQQTASVGPRIANGHFPCPPLVLLRVSFDYPPPVSNT